MTEKEQPDNEQEIDIQSLPREMRRALKYRKKLIESLSKETKNQNYLNLGQNNGVQRTQTQQKRG